MKKRRGKGLLTEQRFRIDAYTPETLPMARLAEYMAAVSQLAGEFAFVHFERLEKGSTVLVSRVEKEAEPKVMDRILSLERGNAAPDVQRAYKSINRLLREDNAVAELVGGPKTRPVRILHFPGVEATDDRIPSVRQQGSVDGIVVRVGGTDATVPVWLEVEGRLISHCHADRPTAKRLAQNLFDPVRLFGRGRWTRDGDGDWSLADFTIESFDVLEEGSLGDALARVRKAAGTFQPDAYEGLQLVRHGPPRKRRHGSD